MTMKFLIWMPIFILLWSVVSILTYAIILTLIRTIRVQYRLRKKK